MTKKQDAEEKVVEFTSGKVRVHVVEDEVTMGGRTAEAVSAELKARAEAGHPTVLWLMAAPSAFPFYRALIEMAKADAGLRAVLRDTQYFQFDDYPISRSSPQFPATFRHLLETSLYRPLAEVCGPLPGVHALELTGGSGDADVQLRYRDALLDLQRKGAFILQLKGTGMDGHWGFHGSETPLDQEPGIITVSMNSQNIRQQMLDWPQLFPTLDRVPARAVTFNVPMFMLADRIIDNTPQPSKEYAVLAIYGTDVVFNEMPSSALKDHPRAESWVTRPAARALLELRSGREQDPGYRLPEETHARLADLWRDERDPDTGRANTALMDALLRKLEII